MDNQNTVYNVVYWTNNLVLILVLMDNQNTPLIMEQVSTVVS